MNYEGLNVLITGIIAAITGLVVAAIPYLNKRMQLTRALSKDINANKIQELENLRVISDEDMIKLKNHFVFLQIDDIVNTIGSTYYDSKKGNGQKIFSLVFYYILKIYQFNCLEQVNRVNDNRKAEKDHVTRLVREAVLNSDANIRMELLSKNIPETVIDAFLQWYKDHFQWFKEQINIVLNKEVSYYEQVKQVLESSSCFASALNAGFKQKINYFNGNIEKELTDEVMLNIDYGKSFLSLNKY